jgi:hypothetical protein
VSRVVVSVVFGLQALLLGSGTILDARAAAESLSRQSHIEDGRTSQCPPFHSDVDCLVCRTMSGGATGGSAAAVPALAVDDHAACDPTVIVVADRIQGGPLGSRAPPRG